MSLSILVGPKDLLIFDELEFIFVSDNFFYTICRSKEQSKIKQLTESFCQMFQF